jgi:hypothetical protein
MPMRWKMRQFYLKAKFELSYSHQYRQEFLLAGFIQAFGHFRAAGRKILRILTEIL